MLVNQNSYLLKQRDVLFWLFNILLHDEQPWVILLIWQLRSMSCGEIKHCCFILLQHDTQLHVSTINQQEFLRKALGNNSPDNSRESRSSLTVIWKRKSWNVSSCTEESRRDSSQRRSKGESNILPSALSSVFKKGLVASEEKRSLATLCAFMFIFSYTYLTVNVNRNAPCCPF